MSHSIVIRRTLSCAEYDVRSTVRTVAVCTTCGWEGPESDADRHARNAR